MVETKEKWQNKRDRLINGENFWKKPKGRCLEAAKHNVAPIWQISRLYLLYFY